MIFLIIGINNTDSEMVVAGFKINALGKITIFVGGDCSLFGKLQNLFIAEPFGKKGHRG